MQPLNIITEYRKTEFLVEHRRKIVFIQEFNQKWKIEDHQNIDGQWYCTKSVYVKPGTYIELKEWIKGIEKHFNQYLGVIGELNTINFEDLKISN